MTFSPLDYFTVEGQPRGTIFSAPKTEFWRNDDHTVRTKAKAVKSSRLEDSQAKADAAIRVDEHNDCAPPCGLLRRTSRTRSKPNSGSSGLFLRHRLSMTPLDTNSKHAPGAMPAIGASEVA